MRQGTARKGTHMIIKNTAANRRLVDRLSEYIRDTTPYFRAWVSKSWNLGEDIRFEITSVGQDNPVLIATEYHDKFTFKVRLLTNQIENAGELIRTAFRLGGAEKVLLNLRVMIEIAHPAVSKRGTSVEASKCGEGDTCSSST